MFNLVTIGVMNAESKRGVSRAQWIEVALQTLAKGNVNDVSIVGLARTLGISKAGFYWHFRSRQNLLDELLQTWIHESTEIATDNKLMEALDPVDRLVKVAEMIHDYDLGRFELAIRDWARTDKVARKAVKRVDRLRFNFTKQALEQLGFSGDELESRTMLFVGYQSGETIFFGDVSRKRRRELIRQRISLLTSK